MKERDELAALIQQAGYCGDFDPDSDFHCEGCADDAKQIADAILKAGHWSPRAKTSEEWGAVVTNKDFVDHGRVYPMESAIEAERWAVSRNLLSTSNGHKSPDLVRVRRVVIKTEWEQA